MPSRRHVLAVASSLLATGCLNTPDTGGQTDEQPTDMAERTATTADCQEGYDARADPFDPTDVLTELDATGRELLATAVNDGGAEHTTYGQALLRQGSYVEHDGAYYRVSRSTVATESVPAYPLDVHWEDGQTAPTDAEPVAFDDLSTQDQRVLKMVVPGPWSDGGGEERAGHPTNSLSVEDAPAPYPSGTEQSVLLDSGTTWVRWNDRTYRVRIDATAEETTERHTYRYTVEEVATSNSGFESALVDRYRIDLTDVPDAQRSILQQAVTDGYDECVPPSTPLKSLMERLPEDQHLPQDTKTWLVRFEGQDYELSVLQWVA
jgi:hypothetical protein